MSSKKAIYESSMLCPFAADDKLADSDFTTTGADVPTTVAEFDSDGFGFGFGIAVSLLTRTDAGTIAVSSGVCCASGLLTTVEAADLTYDGFCGGVGLIAS